jgi:hypothetical protein
MVKAMIHIDAIIDDEVLEQYASQVSNIPVSVAHVINESLTEDKTLDFYNGLVAGLAFSYQVAGFNNGKDHIGSVIATTAQLILRLKYQNPDLEIK